MINSVQWIAGGGLRFELREPDARSVWLVGDFTRWQLGRVRMVLEGDRWHCTVPSVPAGLHAYKFIVDDQWRSDPCNAWGRPDGFGGMNSSLLIDAARHLGGVRALRVASVNLHTYQERDPIEKLRLAASVFASLDVHALALQEVGEGIPGKASEPNAGELIRASLEEMTGVTWWHAWRPAHVGFDRYEEGLSLLSRLPFTALCEHELSTGRLRRIALSAEIGGPVPVRLVTVHTSWPAAGGEQEVFRLLEQIGQTAPHLHGTILAGDLNAGPESRPVMRLRDAAFVDVGERVGEQRGTGRHGHGSAGDRIDYQLWQGVHGRPATLVPLFSGEDIGGIAQPRISDHVGLLGVYEPLLP